jgi:hypothetical protein
LDRLLQEGHMYPFQSLPRWGEAGLDGVERYSIFCDDNEVHLARIIVDWLIYQGLARVQCTWISAKFNVVEN